MMHNEIQEQIERPLHRLVRGHARVQWIPNLVRYENRICLTRIRWERGTVGDGKGYSSKLSVSLIWEPRDIWIGLYWDTSVNAKVWYLCLLPCLPIRFKLVKSWGGIFP